DSPIGIYIDQSTNRIFGSSISITPDNIPFGESFGYEILRDGTIVNRYAYEGQQLLGANDIVAFVPEPSVATFSVFSSIVFLAFIQFKRRLDRGTA
ncbi:MAG: hypothetical protein AAF497_20940, partial [Planctomycetota bacterium]